MSRKDFELIARTIREMQCFSDGEKNTMAWSFADALGTTNPRFDRERFVKACGA